jgi:hypothetical protein
VKLSLPEYGNFTNFDALDFLERELGENHDFAGARLTDVV